jgi:hypothetical protein
VVFLFPSTFSLLLSKVADINAIPTHGCPASNVKLTSPPFLSGKVEYDRLIGCHLFGHPTKS